MQKTYFLRFKTVTINFRLTCLLSFITVSFHVCELTSATLLKCKYQTRDFVWQKYCCVVEELRTDNQTTKVTSVSGNHYESHSDEDVQTLTIENSLTIPYFTNDLFLKFPRIRNLLVVETNLEFLLRGDFENAKYLSNAHISHNLLKTLPNDVFHGANMLKSLNLRNNDIREIDDDAFKSISLLKYLLLSFNKITSLKINLFKELTYLEQLSLAGNQIKSIHSNQFNKNRNLRVLFLSENHIRTFNGKVFKHTTQLRQLYMDNNQIQRISEASTFLNHLEHLQIAAFDNNKCVNTTIITDGGPIDVYHAQRLFEKCTLWR